jgi:hypothetical protein
MTELSFTRNLRPEPTPLGRQTSTQTEQWPLEFSRPRLASPWCNADLPRASTNSTILLECRFADSTISQRICVCTEHLKQLIRTDRLLLNADATNCRYTSDFRIPRSILSIYCNVPHNQNLNVHFDETSVRLINLAPLPSPACPNYDLAQHLETQTSIKCQMRSLPDTLPISYQLPGTTDIGPDYQNVFEHLDITLCHAAPLVKEPPLLRERLFQLSILIPPFWTLLSSHRPDFLPKEPLSSTEIDSLSKPIPTTPGHRIRPSTLMIPDPLNWPTTRPSSALGPDDSSEPILTLDPQSYAQCLTTQQDYATLLYHDITEVSPPSLDTNDTRPATSYTSQTLVRPLSPSDSRTTDYVRDLSISDTIGPPPSYTTD